MNTKYIPLSAVKKSVFYTSAYADIFTPRDEIYLVIFFLFILNRKTESTTLLFPWSFLVRFDFFSVFIGYNIGYGLESYFNEYIVRNQHLNKVI